MMGFRQMMSESHRLTARAEEFSSNFPRPDACIQGERAMKQRIKTMQNCVVVFDLHQTRALWRS
jgi:hypothetical protein